MMCKLTFIFGFLFLLVGQPSASFAQMSDVWVTQAGAGSRTGTTLANAAPISFIQSSSNCGSGSSQIGPGTTIHLSGNFTYPAGTIGAIVLTCSGTSGNPVVITTDPGTRPVIISSQQFGNGAGANPAGALDLHSVSYVKVDGGVPCGTTEGGVDSTNSCGLVIENTASGTAYDVGPANSGQSGLLNVGTGPGLEITSLALLNAYVRLPNWAITSMNCSGTTCTVTCPSSCSVGKNLVIRIVGNSLVSSSTALTVTANNSGGSTFNVSGGPSSGTASGGTAVDESANTNGRGNYNYWAIQKFSPGIKFHDSVVAHGGWLVNLQGAAIQIYNNQIYDFDHGIATSPVDVSGNQPAGCSQAGPIIHDNHLHDMANWDDYIADNNNHHDGIHLLLDTANPTNQCYFVNTNIYNNRFDGDVGVPNAWLFLRASSQNEAVFNNVFGCTPSRHFNIHELGDSSESGSFTTNPLIANNTVTCTGTFAGGGTASGWGTSGTNKFVELQNFNNIWQGQQYVFITYDSGVTWAAGGLDYNLYENNQVDSGGAVGVHPFAYGGGSGGQFDALATWQSWMATGCGGCSPKGTGSPWPTTQGQDTHSVLATTATINLSSSGLPRAGSPAIGRGLNLTPLCTGNLTPLCADMSGNPRPASGPWDIGAYSSNSTANLPAAPTGLVATVQ